jgi:hypothetical protein
MRLVKTSGGAWGIASEYNPDLLPKLRALPGARWDRDARVWRVSTADETLIDLVARLQGLGAVIPEEILARAATLAVAHDAAADEATGRAVDPRLYPFQKDGVRWLAPRRTALLADEMGLGKTVQALLAAPAGAPVLVICPASVKGSWRAECRRWRSDLTPEALAGKGSFRWPVAGELLILNYDILPPVEGLAAPAPGTVLIADECHKAKSKTAQRTKRLAALVAAVLAADGRAWGLTGTPLINRPPELWQVLDNLGLAEEAFGAFGRFYRLFNASRGAYGTTWGQPRAEVPEILRRVMCRRERRAVLTDLPGKTYTMAPVNGLDRETRKAADAALAAWTEWEKAAEARGAKTSEGLPPFEAMSAARAALATAKIPAVLEIAESYEDAGEALVVFSDHRAPVEALGAREGWAAILGGTPTEERTRIVERFQAGALKGIALTFGAGAEGLTLTRAHEMLIVDLPWTSTILAQGEDRICRIGQAHPCHYTTLVAEHALDERLVEVIAGKRGLIRAAIEASAVAPVTSAMAVVEAAQAAQVEARAKAEVEEKAREAAAKARAEEEARGPKCVCGAPVQVKVAGPSSKHPGWKYTKCGRCGAFAWAETDAASYTDEQRTALRLDLERLLGVCDGAHARDGAGFNGTDAQPARYLYADLAAGREIDWGRLEGLLKKYRKTQLAA